MLKHRKQSEPELPPVKTETEPSAEPVIIPTKSKSRISKIIRGEVTAEEIPKTDLSKKLYDDVGIIGNTVEARDFRAIVKKKGKTIKVVLTDLLHKYNSENYNVL